MEKITHFSLVYLCLVQYNISDLPKKPTKLIITSNNMTMFFTSRLPKLYNWWQISQLFKHKLWYKKCAWMKQSKIWGILFNFKNSWTRWCFWAGFTASFLCLTKKSSQLQLWPWLQVLKNVNKVQANSGTVITNVWDFYWADMEKMKMWEVTRFPGTRHIFLTATPTGRHCE